MNKLIQILFAFGFLANPMFPSIPADAEAGLRHWNRTCIRYFKEWKKKPRHKAFVVATTDNYQTCGFSWGHPSIEIAKKEGLNWCKKYPNAGANCVITKAE